MEWRDGQTGLAHLIDGKINDMEVTTTEGYTYKGDFEPGTLDGKGTLCNPEGELIYEGEIQCGYPHGEGVEIKADGTRVEGAFEWGNCI